jgi:hypothetical protein
MTAARASSVMKEPTSSQKGKERNPGGTTGPEDNSTLTPAPPPQGEGKRGYNLLT